MADIGKFTFNYTGKEDIGELPCPFTWEDGRRRDMEEILTAVGFRGAILNTPMSKDDDMNVAELCMQAQMLVKFGQNLEQARLKLDSALSLIPEHIVAMSTKAYIEAEIAEDKEKAKELLEHTRHLLVKANESPEMQRQVLVTKAVIYEHYGPKYRAEAEAILVELLMRNSTDLTALHTLMLLRHYKVNDHIFDTTSTENAVSQTLILTSHLSELEDTILKVQKVVPRNDTLFLSRMLYVYTIVYTREQGKHWARRLPAPSPEVCMAKLQESNLAEDRAHGPHAYLSIKKFLTKVKKYQEAMAILKKGMAAFPRNYFLMHVDITGSYREANFRAVGNARKRYPPDRNLPVYAKCIEACQTMLGCKEFKEDLTALSTLMECSLDCGQKEEASMFYTKCLEIAQKQSELSWPAMLLSSKFNGLLLTGTIKELMSILKEIFEYEGPGKKIMVNRVGNHMGYYNRMKISQRKSLHSLCEAYIFMWQGQHERCLDLLVNNTAVLQSHPMDANLIIAETYWKKGQQNEAATWLGKACSVILRATNLQERKHYMQQWQKLSTHINAMDKE